MNDELKPCPFCEAKLTLFGRDKRDGKIVNVFIHPQGTDTWDRCPLSGLVFDAARWNARPLEDALCSQLAEAQAEVERLKMIIERQNPKRPPYKESKPYVSDSNSHIEAYFEGDK